MAKQQDRFWEVMDPHGQKHVVCASHFRLVGDGIEFLSHTGQVDVDDGLGLARTVAAFSGFIYFKDIVDQAQAGETARESDNLEAQVARATAELTEEARLGPGLTPYEAVTFSARHDAAHAAELVDLFCRTNQIDQELSEHWPDHLRHPKEAEAKGNPGYPAPDAHVSTTACGCGQEIDPSTVAGIKVRLDRIEAEQAKHRDRLAQHREWFERSRDEGQRRGWLKGMAFRLFGGGVV